MDNLEHELTKERLLETVEVLEGLQRAFSSLQMLDEKQDRQAAALGLQSVGMAFVVLDLAKYLHEGKEFYEALRATVRGERKLGKEFEELARALEALRDPTRHN